MTKWRGILQFLHELTMKFSPYSHLCNLLLNDNKNYEFWAYFNYDKANNSHVSNMTDSLLEKTETNNYLCSYLIAQWYLVHGLVQTLENVSLFAFFTKRGLSEDLSKGS